MNNALYWLWIQHALGYGARVEDPLRYFGSARAFYEATEADYRGSEVFGKTRSFSKPRLQLLLNKDLSFAQQILSQCENHGITLVTPDSEAYPKTLLRVPDHPAVLFVKGDLTCLKDRLCIAVIGTRTPSAYAERAAASIAGGLAAQGAVIVSGGALGVDSIAHKAALQQHQPTVLVLGCGIEAKYLMQNQPLRQAIGKTGALVSEYPPFMQPTVGSFPMRNRIISGLSSGIVIVEAGAHSGTLNTARHAKQQHRTIFVLPGDYAAQSFAGSNLLIREGAKPVFSAEDVFSYYDLVYAAPQTESEPHLPFDDLSDAAKPAPPKRKPAKKQNPRVEADVHNAAPEEPLPSAQPEVSMKKISNFDPSAVSKNAALVYDMILNGKTEFDELVLAAALPTPKVLSALTELELFGAVGKGAGNRYFVK